MKTLLRAWPIVVISLIGLLASLEAYTVIIDPGHGGSDPGAVRPGAYEKQLTLSTSVMLAAELRRLGVPYVMTRYNDETRSLTSRRDLAARYPRSVFVSIHCNAAQSTAARGVETFYHDTSGRALGAQVQRALIYMTGAQDRGRKDTRIQSAGKESCSGGHSRRGWIHFECVGASALSGSTLPASGSPRYCDGTGRHLWSTKARRGCSAAPDSASGCSCSSYSEFTGTSGSCCDDILRDTRPPEALNLLSRNFEYLRKLQKLGLLK